MEQISHKKASKSEQRRRALKEYYRLKRLEKEDGLKPTAAQSNEDEPQAPEDELDLQKCDFKTLITQTNKLSLNINTISSTTKNIVYNNYYELIKLNDFLDDLTHLNIYSAVEDEDKKKKSKKSVLEILGGGSVNKEKDTVIPEEIDTFERLRSLMNKIESHDKNTFQKYTAPTNPDNEISNIFNVLQLHESSKEVEEYKARLSETLSKWIDQLQGSGKDSLIHQLRDLQNALV